MTREARFARIRMARETRFARIRMTRRDYDDSQAARSLA